MKSGILGGTFDPIHNGHLALAEAARSQFGLDEIIFLPAGEPWFKAARPVSEARHRVEMVRRAIQGRSGCRLSRLEVERKGPTYTVDTLRELRRRDEETEYYFLLSYGSLREFPAWREPAEIIRLCKLAVAARPGYDRPDEAALEAGLPGLSERVIWLEMAPVDISATMVRARASAGEAITGLVPAPVASYIEEQGLYRAGRIS